MLLFGKILPILLTFVLLFFICAAVLLFNDASFWRGELDWYLQTKSEARWLSHMRWYLLMHPNVDVVQISDFIPDDRWDTIVVYFPSYTAEEEFEAVLGFPVPDALKYCCCGGYLLLSDNEIVRDGNFDDPLKYSESIGIRISAHYQWREEESYFRVLSKEDAVFYVERPCNAHSDICLYPYVDVLEWRDAS